MCTGFVSTKPNPDRDFGCIAAGVREVGEVLVGGIDNKSAPPPPPPPSPPPPPPPPPSLFVSTGAAFASDPDEVIVGLGQHSEVSKGECTGGKGCGQWKMNQKGFVWDLGVSKYQIMMPFYVSSHGYGFFWNHPGEGTVALNNHTTQWNSTMQRQIDFWVTVPGVGGDAPGVGGGAPSVPDVEVVRGTVGERLVSTEGGSRWGGVAAADVEAEVEVEVGVEMEATEPQSPYAALLSQYVDVTGHAPVLPQFATGFWQSKMRYRTSDELLDVAAGYTSRNISLSVIVIDFYSWTMFARCSSPPALPPLTTNLP
jgi:alpha-glucosidase (family GH31 glycosyl hydrolase)